jgi:aspartate/methionine/tyrosine aminotransferase
MGHIKEKLSINQNMLNVEYAIRGPIAQRALEMKKQGQEVISCNIGNPQALGQPPLTYFRTILSLIENPALIERERKIRQMIGTARSDIKEEERIQEDVLLACERILSKSKTGTGAYTESKGFEFVREAVAKFIDKRDGIKTEGGIPSAPEKIFLTNGASQAVKFIINILISEKSDGIMIPIPQYPLYSAEITKSGGTQINYFLNEEQGWTFNREDLESAFSKAVNEGIKPKAIVVINPGNPTGAILTEACMLETAAFAKKHNLMIIADEVYQENVYNGKFTSFAKIIGSEPITLCSIHSISKGFIGECGHRGGYLEVRNPPQIMGTNLDLVDILNKMASVSLCANTPGQILTYLMVNPPEKNTKTHVNYIQEKEMILQDQYGKAEMIRDAFQEMNGIECFGETGALYLFPRLTALPNGSNDFDYCMALLEQTGICTVNGSGFGQKENTHHLRIAFLPSKETLMEALPRWIDFNARYIKK